LAGVQRAEDHELRAYIAKNVILLLTSCSVRKVHHRHISQYFKFQGIPEFVGRQLVTSSTTC